MQGDDDTMELSMGIGRRNMRRAARNLGITEMIRLRLKGCRVRQLPDEGPREEVKKPEKKKKPRRK